MLPITPNRLALALASLAFAVLSACGSQDSASTSEAGINTAHPVSNSTAAPAYGAQTDTDLLKSLAALYPNGQLPANRAAQASQDLSQNPAALKLTAETATPANSQSTTTTAHQQATAQAVAADYQPVQRVQNTTLYGAYFFSIYPSEISAALSGNPNWTLEGPAFWASLANGTDLHPVHRFRNKINGSYLYSIYDSERATIVANYAATYDYEGVAWYARQTIATGWSALYRFRNKTNGTYLFSAYESEKDAIVANYPTIFALEGIAYYVRQDAPDNTAPVITLNGANPLNLTGGTAYTDPGATCTDNKDATCTVVTTGTVDTATVGSYTITYTATDVAGNISSSSRTIHVSDATGPVITVLGANPLVHSLGAAYTDPGATCADNKDATCTVVTTGTVNTAVVGSYTITYTATDAAGNSSSITRTVHVSDVTGPVITVQGTNPLTLSPGMAYTEAGATCVDNKDATCTVTTTGAVNILMAGTYTITYTATDAAGNISSRTRTVNVAACTAAAINQADAYSLVFKGCGVANVAEYYEKTECVRQNSTGLIWQGQTAAGTGLRANDQLKTNFDSIIELQKFNGASYVAPTQADVDASTNSIGFKNAVNASNLCGSGAWRLPTANELLGIVKTTESPNIDNAWFPNTRENIYWTSTPSDFSVVLARIASFKQNLLQDFEARSNASAVRLVR